MPNSELFTPGAGQEDDVQSLRDRISELDEQVSRLNRLEDTLRRNNGLFEALLTASQDGIVLMSPDARIIRVIKSVLGYGSMLTSGLSLYDLIHPEDQAAMRECYSQIVRHRVPQVHYEVRMLNSVGSTVWVEGTITDMLDNPSVLGIVHNSRDVTQRRQTDIAGLELAAVIEQAPFAFFSKDLDGNIQSWNAGAERLFGYTAAEIIGRHIWNLVPAEIQREEGELRNLVIQNRVPMGPLPAVRLHKNGSQIPVELTLTPMIKDGSVRGILHLSQT
jgi:PAS domain S-box-containing protein